MADKMICKINDERLRNYVKRTRSGVTQVFYTGNDSRDFARYESEGGDIKSGIEMHDKPDTIRLTPPEKHYYAQIIDGEWWWVNGCAECNGEPRDWMTYVECEKHNVCRTCFIPRAKLTEHPWGGNHGWQCKPCHELERQETKRKKLKAVAAKEYDECDFHYQDKETCPHCGTTVERDGDYQEGEQECNVCDGKYSVEVEHSVTYSTTVIGDRVIA